VHHALRLLAVTVVALLLAPFPMLRAGPAANVGATFNYTFDWTGTLSEVGRMGDSGSPYWWLSSGAYLYFRNGVGATIQGTLPSNDYWRRYYASTSATDTDNGYRPQNLFRLTTRSRWQNFRQQVYFRIRRDNLSASPNRNGSNGLLLMARYLDQDNLYYAGVRVDGAAVIKKKYRGRYYTLASARMFTGPQYHRTSNPSLLPKDVWLGLRAELRNKSDGTVRISLYIDPGPGGWVHVFDVLDDGRELGPAITNSGYGGVRTDFMDVELENYWAVKLD
jgi:hypothetical protein